MDDLISRQAAIELKSEFLNPNVNRETEEQTAIDRAYARGWNSCNTHWIDEISDLPSAQPERKKGKWIRITQGADPEKYICPFCHRTVENYGPEGFVSIRYPYCHCGADMREVEK